MSAIKTEYAEACGWRIIEFLMQYSDHEFDDEEIRRFAGLTPDEYRIGLNFAVKHGWIIRKGDEDRRQINPRNLIH
jgi:hypothetical protein